MTATVLKLEKMREREPHRIPPMLMPALAAMGIGPREAYTHVELWGRGANSYVMVVAGPSAVQVSYGIKFADRNAARRWASIYAHKHSLDPTPRPCGWSSRKARSALKGDAL